MDPEGCRKKIKLPKTNALSMFQMKIHLIYSIRKHDMRKGRISPNNKSHFHFPMLFDIYLSSLDWEYGINKISG